MRNSNVGFRDLEVLLAAPFTKSDIVREFRIAEFEFQISLIRNFHLAIRPHEIRNPKFEILPGVV